jgi:hypothetical protein
VAFVEMKKWLHSYIPRGSRRASGAYARLLQRLFSTGGWTRSESCTYCGGRLLSATEGRGCGRSYWPVETAGDDDMSRTRGRTHSLCSIRRLLAGGSRADVPVGQRRRGKTSRGGGVGWRRFMAEVPAWI